MKIYILRSPKIKKGIFFNLFRLLCQRTSVLSNLYYSETSISVFAMTHNAMSSS